MINTVLYLLSGTIGSMCLVLRRELGYPSRIHRKWVFPGRVCRMRSANNLGLRPEEHKFLEQGKKTLQTRLNWNVPKDRRKARESGIIGIKGGKHLRGMKCTE